MIKENKREVQPREKWFINRIGKIVYRNKTSCKCEICENVYQKGLIILDEMHADYLYCCEFEYTHEGQTLRYFDTLKERDEFELFLLSLPKI